MAMFKTGHILASLLILQASLFDDTDPFAGARDGISSLYLALKHLLEVVIIIAALVIVARIIIKVMSGDKEAAKNLLWWVIGLAGGLALLEALYMVMSKEFVLYGPFAYIG